MERPKLQMPNSKKTPTAKILAGAYGGNRETTNKTEEVARELRE
jgi:hypothetical protein